MTDTNWDSYWQAEDKDPPFASFYRSHVVGKLVAKYCDAYFPPAGKFIELGCGSGESSLQIPERDRVFVGLDLSQNALSRTQKSGFYSELVLGDIGALPFDDESFDGAWNIGVMEHFKADELVPVLREIYRVLKQNGVAVFFWPTWFGPITNAALVYDTLHAISGSKKTMFPKGYVFYWVKGQISAFAEKAGFKNCVVYLSTRDLFQNAVVIVRKM